MNTIDTWKWIPTNAPVATSRTDDIWFFDENTGWLVNSNGDVSQTKDGGISWTKKGEPFYFFIDPRTPGFPYLRCMAWPSQTVGWVGSVSTFSQGKDYLNILLHKTENGGETWNALSMLPKNAAAGVCGICAVSEDVLYAAGANDPNLPGPTLLKTTNGGTSWTCFDMSEHADNLIDCYFRDETTGWVVGGKIDLSCPASKPGYEAHPQYAQLRPVVLKTTDGGQCWVNTAADVQGFDCGEWGWKIQFLNDQVGFVSLENFTAAAILKTTDGGDSWERCPIVDGSGEQINQNLEGVGFISEDVGWVGGWGEGFEGLLNSATSDGGTTWIAQNNTPGDPNSDARVKINRYRFLGSPPTSGYCSGQTVYKSSDQAGLAAFAAVPVTDGFAMAHTPYDTKGTVAISYTLPENAKEVYVGVWNKFGVHVRTLVAGGAQSVGRHTIVWDGVDENGNRLGSGQYIVRMSVNGERGASQTVRLP